MLRNAGDAKTRCPNVVAVLGIPKVPRQDMEQAAARNQDIHVTVFDSAHGC